ncbi:hypothetical protein [Bacillus paramycoides]|uniref:Uncharacterized protein n=1 Tax=Bacillus paramycoides TaxID=2026194 RepID=A0ABU6N4U7_9BACI|nr:hypothetical protein [Bacillus paramycoides]
MIVIVESVKSVSVVNQNGKKSVVANVSLFVVLVMIVVIENIGKIVHVFLFLIRNNRG